MNLSQITLKVVRDELNTQTGKTSNSSIYSDPKRQDQSINIRSNYISAQSQLSRPSRRDRNRSSADRFKRSSIHSQASERESLERIHTFSLKETKDQDLVRFKENTRVSRESSVKSTRSYSKYLPEKVQIYVRQLRQALLRVNELVKIQSFFVKLSSFFFFVFLTKNGLQKAAIWFE